MFSEISENLKTAALRAEILLTMYKIIKNESFKSFDDLNDVIKASFTDSNIAKLFCCDRSKATYITKEAFGPYYRNKMLESIDGGLFYTILFDETPNSITEKELQVSIRFFFKTYKRSKISIFFLLHKFL